MRRVLLLSHRFPPLGGAGVQRSLKFARYLPELGYRPLVVTGPGAAGGRWTPADPTLGAEVPSEADVLRVPGPEPARDRGRRAERWLWLRSPWGRWWVRSAVERAMSAGKVDAVLASVPPYESCEGAARIAARLGVPWIADLRDPWALDEMRLFPSALHRRVALGQMRRSLSSAAAIVVTSPEAEHRLREQFPELGAKTIATIPNGFDAEDFAGTQPERHDGAFRIVHAGYLHTELGRHQRRTAHLRRLLGGSAPDVDLMTRSHAYLLEAVERLVERGEAGSKDIEVPLAGVMSGADRAVASRSRSARIHGYLPHAEAVALMRSANLLFLPMHDLPDGGRATIVPGKTYEYLAAGRPILAALPGGDARDILRAAGNAYLCSPGDTGAMADAIAAEVSRARLEVSDG